MKTVRNLIVLPYRDSYFVHKYGYAVRDVQIVEELSRLPFFNEIVVVNRPVTIYERLLRRKLKGHSVWPNLKTVDSTSYEILGPLKKRGWLKECYKDVLFSAVEKFDNPSCDEIVVLDFHPFGMLPDLSSSARSKFIYWFDMIDNFSIHNRFSGSDKLAVVQKYVDVRSRYDFVSGVSKEALQAVGHQSSFVMPNGVYYGKGFSKSGFKSKTPNFDFGFVGFVTDKFDIGLVKVLREKGHSIIVHGAVLDSSVGAQLKALGVVLGGPFSYAEIGEKILDFSIGLLPYLKDKEHDGSPLKLYEYLKWNRPCFTTIDYELRSDFVYNISQGGYSASVFDFFKSISGGVEVSGCIEDEWKLSFKVKECLSKFLTNL